MSIEIDNTARTIIIVGVVAAVIIALAILASIIRCVRRRNVAAKFKAQNGTNPSGQGEQRQMQLPVDGGDLEYGLDTRAEAQPSSYHGGMADVSHFGGSANRAFYCPPQSEVAILGKTSSNRIAPPLKRRSSQPNLGSTSSHPTALSPQQLGTNLTARTSLDQGGPVYDSPAEMARSEEEDVPPAYCAVVQPR